MKNAWMAVAVLVLGAGCTPEAPPRPVSTPPRPPVNTAPVVAKAPPPVVPAPPYPAPVPLPPPPPPAPPPPPPVPAKEYPLGQVYLPAFTFRTMDHAKIHVLIDGLDLGATPCLWAISETIEFDPKIPVPEWPPQGAKYAASSEHPERPGDKVEIYIASAKDDFVVYVNGRVAGRPLQGALKGRAPGYRWIVYTPLDIPEGEAMDRYARTLWLERNENP